MRITLRTRTLGSHTHMDLWVDGGLSAEDIILRNEHVPEFLARLRPERIEDTTPTGHQRVAFA